MMTLPEFNTHNKSKPVTDRFTVQDCECRCFADTFECRALFYPEGDGGYSAHALRLPGVATQGDTLQEAVENLRDAFREAMLAYREQEMQIPWEEIEIDRPKDSVEQWILVNV